MKILVDQNLPVSLVERLAAAGHDAVHTAGLGLESASDLEVFRVCIAQGRVLVTADKKLTKFLAATGAMGPSVVVVRGFARGSDVAATLAANLGAINEAIAGQGPAVFSVSSGKPIRVELLPLGRID